MLPSEDPSRLSKYAFGARQLSMALPVWAKAGALWFAILVLAMLNGALREKVLIPAMGSFGACAASGAVLAGCIVAVAFLAAPWYGPLRSAQWWLVGLFWLLLTLLFEFGFGRFVQHKPWAELLQAYAFKGGNLWPLVLAITLSAPWLAARWRGLVQGNNRDTNPAARQ